MDRLHAGAVVPCSTLSHAILSSDLDEQPGLIVTVHVHPANTKDAIPDSGNEHKEGAIAAPLRGVVKAVRFIGAFPLLVIVPQER
jgi:hypothetical protein